MKLKCFDPMCGYEWENPDTSYPQPCPRCYGVNVCGETVEHDKQAELADMVNHPSHYTSTGIKCQCGQQVEVIQITQELNFCLGNVVKYVLRAGKKGAAIEDLEKARKYIDFEINRLRCDT